MKKRGLNVLIVIFLTIIVLYFALKDNYRTIIDLLSQANIIMICIGCILVLTYTCLKAIVTKNIINDSKKYSLYKTFKLQMMTLFFNAITPFCSGGQPFQIYILNKNKLSISQASNVVLQETIIHQVALSIIIILTFILNLIFNIYNLNFSLLLFLIIGFLLNNIVVVLLIMLAYGKNIDTAFAKIVVNILFKLKFIKDKEEKMDKCNKAITSFNQASKLLLKNKKKLFKLISINVLAIICLYLVPVPILFSFGNFTAYNSLTSVILVAFVTIISCYIPLPGATLGQEYLFLLLFGAYVQEPLVNSIMLLWRGLTYYFPMIIGALIFDFNKRNDVSNFKN